jgi:hypothetical protein
MDIDDHPSCRETFATFRIGKDTLVPEDLSRELGLEPSGAHRNGDLMYPRNPTSDLRQRSGLWSLCTKGRVDSHDVRRHVDWLLDRLDPKAAVLARLGREGCAMDIFCYWCSAAGQGGPMLDPGQMGRLARLGLPILFDVYSSDEADRSPADG